MSSHLPPNSYINPFFLHFSFHSSPSQFLKTPYPSQICYPLSPTMAKTRGPHSFRPRVRRSSTPPAGTSTQGAAGHSTVVALPLPLPPLPQLLRAPQSPPPPLLQLPSRVLPLLMLRAPPLWLLPKGDITPGLVPLRLLHHIPSQPRGHHNPRGPELQAPGSRLPRDPERHPHHLIREM